MRICFISRGDFTHIGAYLDAFKAAGYDVHFISLSPSPERGVPTYNVGLGNKYTASEGKWKFPFSMVRARWLVRNLKADIVHAHYATSGGLTGLVCGFHPTIVTVHGSDLVLGMKSRIWRRLLRAVFNHADCINTVSEPLRDMVLKLDIPSGKIETLTLGVDTDRFCFTERPAVSPKRKLQLVCTRKMERHYDHATIVGALAILAKRGLDFHMTFVGDGTLREELFSRVVRAGLKDAVSFLQVVDYEEIPGILEGHDVYLSASLWDGTSLSLLEAMASGVFPIVSNIEANWFWLEHGVDGLLHKVGDANDLADCVMQLFEKPELMATAAWRNRERVVQKADRRTNMRHLSSIYQRLVSDTSRNDK